ncbi:MAG: NADH-ubiquinone oxidoreductase-F iron-sulfur binding region domain-containing protein [Candidatus Aceula meridiana]|nr:NADH-ubiquinone oxidoreductase-F iron-sulfur binding region domain-containing protein [Candidatus Aceula meridiana]
MGKLKKIILVKDTANNKETVRFAELFNSALRDRALDEQAQVVRAADINIYNQGVVVRIMPSDITYVNVNEKDIDMIIRKSIKNNDIVKEILAKPEDKQIRIVLRNCGNVDPENIEDYLAADGYLGLKKVLELDDRDKVIEEIKKSGLRGRGGGGFPTWMKWNFAKEQDNETKFIICNADEGDPGAYMDRSVLEGDPHTVVEGMIIAGFAIGAKKGYFYIRAEYPLAILRVNLALSQAREKGLLGQNILGTDFSFELEIRLGAGAFVCGEETALIASIEGKRGCPVPRPPYPSVIGLWGKPTVINNVETLSSVAPIICKGGDWLAKIGTEKSKGTKVFALTGKIANSSLIEVPMGITFREIVYDIGGGVPDNKNIKAVQTGGPSGGVIPEKFFDTPIDYENLQNLGSIMGSGGMIVMDEDDCMVDIAKFYLKFCVDESCGKCAPCRIGGKQMLDLLTEISEGKGTQEHIEKLKTISHTMQKASLCGLGQTAPNPVMSTLKYFENEYIDHIEHKKCTAGKCESLYEYKVIEEKCRRCGLCKRNCPVDAIVGDKDEGYKIIQEKCIKCGKCYEVCKFEAISRGNN